MAFTDSTLSHLRPNPLWSELPEFDRSGWKRFQFGKIAECIGERVEKRDEPAKAVMQAQTDAATESVITALPNALAHWVQSAGSVLIQLNTLISAK
ncbi:MAG: hypothetical protein KA152_00060 [Verrucomicrobiales bacterium]|jgi:hypothetical protein|nr:hypothetical protein [Verrucomicrobiales bacterium]